MWKAILKVAVALGATEWAKRKAVALIDKLRDKIAGVAKAAELEGNE